PAGPPPGEPATPWPPPPTSTCSTAHERASTPGAVASATAGRDPSAPATSSSGPKTASAPSSPARCRRASERCTTATRAPAAWSAHIPMIPSGPAPTPAGASDAGHIAAGRVEHRHRVETARERFDRGREVEREAVERHRVALGHDDALGDTAVALGPDVQEVRATGPQPE